MLKACFRDESGLLHLFSDFFFCLTMFQAYILLGDEEYLFIFQEAYGAAMHYLYNDPW